MDFCEIKLYSVPSIKTAYNVEIKNYQNTFNNRKNYLEICFCEEGDITIDYFDGRTKIATPGTIISIFKDSAFTSSYQGEKHQKHISVVAYCEYEQKKHESSKVSDIGYYEDIVRKENVILIPELKSLEIYTEKVIKSMNRIVRLKNSDNPSNSIKALSEWFILMEILTNYVLNYLRMEYSKISPFQVLYTEMCEKIIKERYNQKLTVSNIAEEIGISESYLHRIFHIVKGISINDYINKFRIDLAQKLIIDKKITLNDLSNNVGFSDPAYMSRVFKKYTGKSYRDYVNEIYQSEKLGYVTDENYMEKK